MSEMRKWKRDGKTNAFEGRRCKLKTRNACKFVAGIGKVLRFRAAYPESIKGNISAMYW